MSSNYQSRWVRGVRYAIALLVCIPFALPGVWAVTASLRPTGQPFPRSLDWLPPVPAWGNYREVFTLIPLGQYALTSFVVAIAAAAITIVIASMTGTALALIDQRWRMRALAVSLAALMVPLTAIWLPRFVLFKEAGLVDHRVALVIPALMGTSPLYVLLFLWSMLRIPRQVFESARLDGAGPLRLWLQIGLPLSRSTIVAVGILTFTRSWNSYIEPLLLIRSASNRTTSLGLRALYQLDRTNWPVLMAGAVMITAPVLILFIVAHRSFLQEYRASGWSER